MPAKYVFQTAVTRKTTACRIPPRCSLGEGEDYRVRAWQLRRSRRASALSRAAELFWFSTAVEMPDQYQPFLLCFGERPDPPADSILLPTRQNPAHFLEIYSKEDPESFASRGSKQLRDLRPRGPFTSLGNNGSSDNHVRRSSCRDRSSAAASTRGPLCRFLPSPSGEFLDVLPSAPSFLFQFCHGTRARACRSTRSGTIRAGDLLNQELRTTFAVSPVCAAVEQDRYQSQQDGRGIDRSRGKDGRYRHCVDMRGAGTGVIKSARRAVSVTTRATGWRLLGTSAHIKRADHPMHG